MRWFRHKITLVLPFDEKLHAANADGWIADLSRRESYEVEAIDPPVEYNVKVNGVAVSAVTWYEPSAPYDHNFTFKCDGKGPARYIVVKVPL